MSIKKAEQTQQITVRIDTELLNAAQGAMKEGERLADIIEQGIYLAINEWRQLTPLAKEVRFIANNLTKDQQRLVQGLLIAMVEPLVGYPRARVGQELWKFIVCFLESRSDLPHASACIASYANYGKKPGNAAPDR
jgi:hypothetical protein